MGVQNMLNWNLLLCLNTTFILNLILNQFYFSSNENYFFLEANQFGPKEKSQLDFCHRKPHQYLRLSNRILKFGIFIVNQLVVDGNRSHIFSLLFCFSFNKRN